jgi:calcineurin-like phosphoesterase family protein
MKNMANTWFTADCHFGHFNIINYSNRPFKTTEEMNKELIKRWNERVKPEDTVYFLGDFGFKSNAGKGNGDPVNLKEYVKKLNGNIIFIRGNHDGNNKLNQKITSLVLEMGGLEIFCTHDPINSNNFYKLNLVGHVHKLWKSRKDTKFGHKTILINVGTDVWNYYPVSFQEIYEEYSKYIKR